MVGSIHVGTDGVLRALWWNSKVHLKLVAGYFKGVFGRSCLIAPNHSSSTFLTRGNRCRKWVELGGQHTSLCTCGESSELQFQVGRSPHRQKVGV